MSKLRTILAVVLLAGLLYWVGAGELVAVLADVDPLYVFYLLLLSVVMIWASCLKWRLFIRAGGNDAPIVRLMRLYTIGYFVNTFTPSYVGGDIVRSFHLGQRLSSQRDAFIATFLERFTGLLAMAGLGVFFVLIGAEATKGLQGAILLVGFGAFLLAAACFSARLGRLAFTFLNRVLCLLPCRQGERLGKLLEKVEAGMAAARSKPKLLFNALILSFFFHILTVLNTYIAARAVGWDDAPFGGLFIVVPLVLLVGMLPLTPGGLGLQEGAFLFFLQRIGATQAEGLGVGVVLRAKIMLIAALGGLLWLSVRGESSPSLSTGEDGSATPGGGQASPLSSRESS